MSRSKSKNRTSRHNQRDTSAISTGKVSGYDPNYDPDSWKKDIKWVAPYKIARTTNKYLQEVQDRRYWDPLETPPARLLNSSRHRLKIKRLPNVTGRKYGYPHTDYTNPVYYPSAKIGFINPERVLICIRRKVRRAVLHALNLTSSGRGGSKRLNPFSKIGC